MAGGVSANRTLRAKLAEMMQKRRGEVFMRARSFCTDNRAMIAYAGVVRFKAGVTADLGVTVRHAGRWPSCRRKAEGGGMRWQVTARRRASTTAR